MRSIARLVSLVLVATLPATAAPVGAAPPGATPSGSEGTPTEATDWLQFRGPDRAGVSPQAGLLRSWTEAGPRVVWRRHLGEGFSGFAISGEHFYTLFSVEKDEFVGGFEAASGEEIWRTRIGETFSDEFGKGPRSTPTVDGDTVVVLGGRGNLMSVRAATGEVHWQVDLHKDFPFFGPRWDATGFSAPIVQIPNWGYSGSPLVVGELVLVETGAREGKSIVAFDAKTGDVRWTALDDVLGYSSLSAVSLHGQLQILAMTSQEIVSLLPSGEVIWRHPWPQPSTLSQPVFLPPDKIFLSENSGAVMLKVSPASEGTSTEGGPTVEPVWQSRALKNFWNSSVAYQGHIYGFDNATLKCISAETGEQRWAKRGLGKGSLVIADGLLLVYGDQGQLTLVETTPEAFAKKGQIRVFEAARTWTPPAIADGKLYLRGPQEMVCMDLEG